MTQRDQIDPFAVEDAQHALAERAKFESELEIADLKWLMSNEAGASIRSPLARTRRGLAALFQHQRIVDGL